MFLRFYQGESALAEAKEFANQVLKHGRNVSPAQIQGYFMFHKTSKSKEVIESVNMIWEL